MQESVEERLDTLLGSVMALKQMVQFLLVQELSHHEFGDPRERLDILVRNLAPAVDISSELAELERGDRGARVILAMKRDMAEILLSVREMLESSPG